MFGKGRGVISFRGLGRFSAFESFELRQERGSLNFQQICGSGLIPARDGERLV
jgi:hypothetical protein